MMKIQESKNITVIMAADGDHHLVHKLNRLIQKLGHKMSFVGWDRKNILDRQFSKDNVEYRYIQHGWGFSNLGLLIAIPLWFLRLLYFATFKLQTDMIFVSDLDSAFAISLIAPIKRIPYIYDVRDNFALRHHWMKKLTFIINMLERWTMMNAEEIIVVDETRIIGPVKDYSEKVTVIYNCPEDFKPKQLTKNINEKPFTILASGLLISKRGISFLLSAAELIQNIKIIMAGRFTERDTMQEALKSNSVSFYGWLPREDALQLCFMSDLIFSMYDPIDEIGVRAASNKWFDAMMAGKPILANREVIRSEWIEREQIGYLCSYGNVDEIVKTIEYIRSNPKEAAKRGENGRKLYEVKFNWHLMENKLIEVFNRVLPLSTKYSR